MNPDKPALSVEAPAGSGKVDDAGSGLPGGWPAVYLVVFGCFILWVVLLALLTLTYS